MIPPPCSHRLWNVWASPMCSYVGMETAMALWCLCIEFFTPVPSVPQWVKPDTIPSPHLLHQSVGSGGGWGGSFKISASTCKTSLHSNLHVPLKWEYKSNLLSGRPLLSNYFLVPLPLTRSYSVCYYVNYKVLHISIFRQFSSIICKPNYNTINEKNTLCDFLFIFYLSHCSLVAIISKGEGGSIPLEQTASGMTIFFLTKGKRFKLVITIWWSEKCTTSSHLHDSSKRQIQVRNCHIYFYCKGDIIPKY